jgi:hypothetical protein
MGNAQRDASEPKIPVERVQLGVRMEKRMVKVLKAMAEYYDISLGQLLEDIVLHAFEGGGANAFLPDSLERVAELKKVYGMDYDVHASYRFAEQAAENAAAKAFAAGATKE